MPRYNVNILHVLLTGSKMRFFIILALVVAVCAVGFQTIGHCSQSLLLPDDGYFWIIARNHLQALTVYRHRALLIILLTLALDQDRP